jgi:hypothetical protein
MLQDHTGLFKTVGELHGELEVSVTSKFLKEMVSAELTWLLITQLMLTKNYYDFDLTDKILNKFTFIFFN